MPTITMSYIRHANKEAGNHFFSEGALRFFSSIIGHVTFATDDGEHAFFVTSEKHEKRPRLYTVRIFTMQTGDVSTHGEFQAYKSEAMAERAAEKAALEYGK